MPNESPLLGHIIISAAVLHSKPWIVDCGIAQRLYLQLQKKDFDSLFDRKDTTQYPEREILDQASFKII
jgi:hypothetical protein